MKKLMLATAVMSALLLASQVTFAQSSASANVTVQAKVIAALSITPTTATLNFGDVAQGTSPVVAPASGGIAFTVTGEPNHAATLVYSATATLNGPGGATLTFTANVIGNATNSTSGAASFPSSITLSGTGNYYIWLGGNLGNIPANQATGNYSGNYTITVQY